MDYDVDDGGTRTWPMPELIGSLPAMLGYTPAEELLAIPVHLNHGLAIRLGIDDACSMSAADYAIAGQQLYAATTTGELGRSNLVLIAVTRDAALGRQALDRARMFLHHPIACRVHTDAGHWHDVNRNLAGRIQPIRINPSRGPTDDAVLAESTRARSTWADRVLGSQESYAAERDWIAATIEQATTTGTPLNDTDAARMLLDLRHTELRDFAITGVGSTNARPHVTLWTDLAGRAPKQDLTPAATVAALSLFLDGQPHHARAMLDRAPEGKTYTLARLLDRILEFKSDPRDFGPHPEIPLVWPPTGQLHGHPHPRPPARPTPSATPRIDASDAGSPTR